MSQVHVDANVGMGENGGMHRQGDGRSPSISRFHPHFGRFCSATACRSQQQRRQLWECLSGRSPTLFTMNTIPTNTIVIVYNWHFIVRPRVERDLDSTRLDLYRCAKASWFVQCLYSAPSLWHFLKAESGVSSDVVLLWVLCFCHIARLVRF